MSLDQSGRHRSVGAGTIQRSVVAPVHLRGREKRCFKSGGGAVKKQKQIKMTK